MAIQTTALANQADRFHEQWGN